MVKPEKFGHLHLVYNFTVPLSGETSTLEDTMSQKDAAEVVLQSQSLAFTQLYTLLLPA